MHRSFYEVKFAPTFWLFLLKLLDKQIWVAFGPILEWGQNESIAMNHITILKNWCQNWITKLEKTMNLIFIWQLEYSIQSFSLFGSILTLWRYKDC